MTSAVDVAVDVAVLVLMLVHVHVVVDVVVAGFAATLFLLECHFLKHSLEALLVVEGLCCPRHSFLLAEKG